MKDILNFNEFSAEDRREIIDALKEMHSVQYHKDRKAGRDARAAENEAKYKRVVDFVNSEDLRNEILGVWRGYGYPKDMAKVARGYLSLHVIKSQQANKRYNEALDQISKGFKIIDDIKIEHIKICEEEKLDFSEYFRSSLSRVNKYEARKAQLEAKEIADAKYRIQREKYIKDLYNGNGPTPQEKLAGALK
jgi:hypothetical protein